MLYRLRSVLKANAWALYLGLLTGATVVLFQVISLLVIYRYLKLDLYLSLIAIVALAAGWHLKKETRDPSEKVSAVITDNGEERPIFPTESGSVNPLAVLTSKEIVVLKFLAGSKTNKEIAGELFIEVSTVKTHINNIYGKLSISNRKEARLKYADLAQSGSFS